MKTVNDAHTTSDFIQNISNTFVANIVLRISPHHRSIMTTSHFLLLYEYLPHGSAVGKKGGWG